MQTCPICYKQVEPFERYLRYVCNECVKKACIQDGRSLIFFNESLSGGYAAKFADTGDPYPSHDCFIHSIKCYADEHRFGGIVLERVQ